LRLRAARRRSAEGQLHRGGACAQASLLHLVLPRQQPRLRRQERAHAVRHIGAQRLPSTRPVQHRPQHTLKRQTQAQAAAWARGGCCDIMPRHLDPEHTESPFSCAFSAADDSSGGDDARARRLLLRRGWRGCRVVRGAGAMAAPLRLASQRVQLRGGELQQAPACRARAQAGRQAAVVTAARPGGAEGGSSGDAGRTYSSSAERGRSVKGPLFRGGAARTRHGSRRRRSGLHVGHACSARAHSAAATPAGCHLVSVFRAAARPSCHARHHVHTVLSAPPRAAARLRQAARAR
jgi:hypothetical protein